VHEDLENRLRVGESKTQGNYHSSEMVAHERGGSSKDERRRKHAGGDFREHNVGRHFAQRTPRYISAYKSLNKVRLSQARKGAMMDISFAIVGECRLRIMVARACVPKGITRQLRRDVRGSIV
jgi:hypothetical protein